MIRKVKADPRINEIKSHLPIFKWVKCESCTNEYRFERMHVRFGIEFGYRVAKYMCVRCAPDKQNALELYLKCEVADRYQPPGPE